MVDASLPGITIQPQYLLSVHGEGSADASHKNTVFSKTPGAGHHAGGRGKLGLAGRHHPPGSRAWCDRQHAPGPDLEPAAGVLPPTRRGGQRLIDDPAIRIKLARVYSELESVRLLSVRNFWMSYTHVKQSYEGPQVSYYRRIIGLGLTKQIQDIVGLAALTDDPRWGAMDGFAEAHQRSAIVAMHPGGTTDIQRVIMARRLGIGNRSREKRGQLAPAAAPSA